jgi:large subunit ribosomal protein L10
MKKSEKPFFVENLTKELKDATAVVLFDYTGLSVKMQQDLKNKLRTANTKMLIAKNTLFKIAGKNAKLPKETLENSVVAGPTALAITEDDPIAPLQVLGKFAKEFELPQFKVGVIEGLFQNKEGLIQLSKLPSKDALVGQAVGTIAAPLYGIVGVLSASMQNLISVLKQASEKK